VAERVKNGPIEDEKEGKGPAGGPPSDETRKVTGKREGGNERAGKHKGGATQIGRQGQSAQTQLVENGRN